MGLTVAGDPVAQAGHLARTATRWCQQMFGRRPFLVRRNGRDLHLVRFFAEDGGDRLYGATWRGRRAHLLTREEVRDLARFVGVAAEVAELTAIGAG